MFKSNETTQDMKPAPSIDIWTTVGKSRKNKENHQNCLQETDTGHKSDESKETSSSLEVQMQDMENLKKTTRGSGKKDKQKKKLKTKSNETPDDKETELSKDKNKNTSRPLEEMKELFYQEKAVEIISLQPEEPSKNKSSRAEKNKSKTTKKSTKMSKSPKIEEMPNKAQNDNDNLMAELMGMNFPVLFFHPFMNFEDQLLQDQSSQSKQVHKSISPKLKESSAKERIHYNPHPMTFLDPSFSPHMISDYSHPTI